ncbi:MAG: NAD(P)H-hydrate dehydratase [Lewinella sp.]|uniref:NAD(P)H-hydrate dehydratase n=1 Tax=Lewinella sp. TaxID=2004506 RepID=UPI003D6AD3C9
MLPLKILSAAQIRILDQQTISLEPISSYDLMERASRTFVQQYQKEYTDLDQQTLIVCGPGNNGGDGLAIARMLYEASYEVSVLVVNLGKSSEDQQTNLKRLHKKRGVPIQTLSEGDKLPDLTNIEIIIDGLFGSGLNRPISSYWEQLITHLNENPARRIAIDIPSGLFADSSSRGIIFKADRTYTFQLPKLSFFAPENAPYIGRWTVLDIQLHQQALATQTTAYSYFPIQAAAGFLKTRGRFDHKGTFGHSLIIAGSYGKIGAAILSVRAALRAGCGLVTTHLPVCGYEIMQIAFPEAMVLTDPHREVFTTPPDLGAYAAIGIGPGLGTNSLTQAALLSLLKKAQQPLVLDADALNILGEHSDWQTLIPKNSILTPHPKEFSRLFGQTTNSFSRWKRLQEKAQQLQCYILLKGGNTAIATPEGQLFFLTVGNPGMGTAGAGDVLTGIICGLLAQGYTSKEAALLGTCLHGLAGDLAAVDQQMESIIAEDIIQYLGKAFAKLRTYHG